MTLRHKIKRLTEDKNMYTMNDKIITKTRNDGRKHVIKLSNIMKQFNVELQKRAADVKLINIINQHDGRITAIAQGSSDYKVEVLFNTGRRPLISRCECMDYFIHQRPCKHVLALVNKYFDNI